MTENGTTQQPIGYWLSRTDQALTTRMNELLQGDGLTRVGWQVLNVLQPEDGVPETRVYDMLQANASQATLIDTINDLFVNGWVLRIEHEPDAPVLMLTEGGRAHRKRMHDCIAQFRQQSLHGITAEEYQLAISVLERIVRNVE